MQRSTRSFESEEISFLKGVLVEACAALPTRLRTSAVQALVAERILKHAAKGERDRSRLLSSSLLDLQTNVGPLVGIEEMRTD
jgi:hypothetical protein